MYHIEGVHFIIRGVLLIGDLYIMKSFDFSYKMNVYILCNRKRRGDDNDDI